PSLVAGLEAQMLTIFPFRDLKALVRRYGVDRIYIEASGARQGLDERALLVWLAGDALREAERRAATSLGVPALEVAVSAWALWQHGLTEERDRLAKRTGDDDSDRMRAAWVTRRLVKQLATRIREARRRKR